MAPQVISRACLLHPRCSVGSDGHGLLLCVRLLARSLVAVPALFAAGMPAISSAQVVDGPGEGRGSKFSPDSVFVQVGKASDVVAVTAGVTWDTDWRPFGKHWPVYLEAALSQWHTRSSVATDHGVLSQVGLTPVFRYHFDSGASPWFFEAAVGLTVTSHIYRNSRTRMGSTFNFGDHLALGYSFGDDRRHELALRIEHFSNGGFSRPNPGKDFVQVRYAYRF